MTDLPTQTDALLALAVLAARADGTDSKGPEQDELEKLAADLAAAIPTGASNERRDDYVELLRGPETHREAYATALGVCRADGKLSKRERRFLRELGGDLGLDKRERRALLAEADTLASGAVEPLDPAVDERVDDMVRNTAILAGALELLPQTLGAIGIVGLQVRLVKKIARQYGKDPSTRKVREFLATAGVGLAGQALEIYVRRAAKQLRERGFLGRLAGRMAGPAFTFATTYALGQLAQRHYGGAEDSRTLDEAGLRSTFGELFEGAKRLATESEEAIRHRAAGLRLGDLASLLR